MHKKDDSNTVTIQPYTELFHSRNWRINCLSLYISNIAFYFKWVSLWLLDNADDSSNLQIRPESIMLA